MLDQGWNADRVKTQWKIILWEKRRKTDEKGAGGVQLLLERVKGLLRLAKKSQLCKGLLRIFL